ncbi:hypothetical protein KBD20_02060 [Candidatus Saccharibacteria bacterium]|nr:hypothetical protein [Candidatus Saccharibacteria bacterium]
MKIQKRKMSRKKILITTIAVLILFGIGGYLAYVYFSSTNNSSTSINYDEATSEQKNAGNQTKDSSVDANDKSKPISGSDQPAAPVPQENGKGKISATMTAANQNGSLVQIRFDIGGVTSTGTCTLTLKNGSKSVTKSTGVQALAGSTTCKGFDVPVSELSPGVWQTTLHFENDSLAADTAGTIEVQ